MSIKDFIGKIFGAKDDEADIPFSCDRYNALMNSVMIDFTTATPDQIRVALDAALKVYGEIVMQIGGWIGSHNPQSSINDVFKFYMSFAHIGIYDPPKAASTFMMRLSAGPFQATELAHFSGLGMLSVYIEILRANLELKLNEGQKKC